MSDKPKDEQKSAWQDSATEINQLVKPEPVDIVLQVQNVSVDIDTLLGGNKNG